MEDKKDNGEYKNIMMGKKEIMEDKKTMDYEG